MIGFNDITRETLHPLAPHPCEWRCTACTHEWIASAKKRTSGRAGSGCPKCGRLRTINARRIAQPGKSLTDIYPQVAAEFIENLENELTAVQLKPQSAYQCRWRCGTCRHEWIATPQNRTRGNTGCPSCFAARRGKWKRHPDGTSRTAHEILGDIADEFVQNLTTPGVGLTELKPGSADKCDWICSTCGHIWVATVASRVRSHRNRPGSGCRKCYDRRIATHRRLPKQGESLNDRHPRISRSFVENLTTPGEGPGQLKVGSNDRCRWRCPNGHEWEARVLTRTNGSECPRCSSAGRSRFELEVRFLLEASTGTDILCDFEIKELSGASGRSPRVDLFVPEIQLYIDLDPLHTHKSERTIANDTRKSLLLRNLNYVRVRARGLPQIPGETLIVNDATRDGIDPHIWTSTLRPLMTAHGLPFNPLPTEGIKQALLKAAEAWAETKGKVRYASAATKHPHLVAEFRRNLTNPLFDLSLRSPSSSDVAEWQCHKCGRTWESTIRNRATKGSGCHFCHRQGVSSNNKARSSAPPGQSLAELEPEIASRFIRCLKDPNRNPHNLRMQSNLECEWYCHTGRHTFTAAVFSVSRGAKRRCCR